ncbi:MAG: c-type cytochrome domain-containing protein [Pirellulaceae bacterium]
MLFESPIAWNIEQMIVAQRVRLACIWLLAFTLGTTTALAQDGVDFEKQIKPIFEANCLRCHGPEREETFRIDDRDAAMDFIEADDAENSDLFYAISSDDPEDMMPPPDEGGPLAQDEIDLIEKWIDAGADWPDGLVFAEPVTTVADDGDDTAKAPVEPGSMGVRIWNAIGSLHPASTHMPIGLLLAAGLFSLLGIRGNFVMSDSAYYCLWLGTLTAIAATVLGWSYADTKGSTADLQELWATDSKFFMHRVLGVGVAVGSLLLSLYAARARALDPDDGFLWKLGAIILAGVVGWCGMEGGKLMPGGKTRYNELKSVVEDLTGLDVSEHNNKNEPAENSDVGKSSEESSSQESNKEDSATDVPTERNSSTSQIELP